MNCTGKILPLTDGKSAAVTHQFLNVTNLNVFEIPKLYNF